MRCVRAPAGNFSRWSRLQYGAWGDGGRAESGQVCGYGGALAPSQHPLATLQLTRHPVSPLARAGRTWHRGPKRSRAPRGQRSTRCSLAPISPLSSQHIPPTLQNGRRPPASPSPSEPGVGSLAPVCGSVWQGQESTVFLRVVAAPMLKPAAMLYWSGGRSEGRCWLYLCCALAWWPGAIFRIKWAPPHGRRAVCTLVRVKNRLE